MNNELKNKKVAVIGMGISNISVIKYLMKQDIRGLSVFDTRHNPPHVDELPVGIDLRLGQLDAEVLKQYDLVVISPGFSIYHEEIAKVIACGIEVVGDIELFAREAKAPIIGITGSNGKSTVTSLTGFMADMADKKVAIGANIGIPVFDILSDDIELYVLELSSFELETTRSLNLLAGTILNVSEDHLDRYHGDIEEYSKVKHGIFRHCQNAIVNRDDPRSYPYKDDLKNHKIITFGSDNSGNYGLDRSSEGTFLTRNRRRIINVKELRLYGIHNYLNALACLALTECAGISSTSQLKSLRRFSGLPHRCQLVKTVKGVSYYNDSKATNVASTEAAIRGLESIHHKGIILLAGGLGKGQDFTPLKQYLGREVKTMICFGKDKQKLLELSSTKCLDVETMAEAVKKASEIATDGQAVLLSPACASFDQFKGFEDRGQQFVSMVGDLGE